MEMSRVCMHLSFYTAYISHCFLISSILYSLTSLTILCRYDCMWALVICVCRLVCGDVRGRFAQLFTRVSNIQKKAGQFDVIFDSVNNILYVIYGSSL